jgi:hypothetical protein
VDRYTMSKQSDSWMPCEAPGGSMNAKKVKVKSREKWMIKSEKYVALPAHPLAWIVRNKICPSPSCCTRRRFVGAPSPRCRRPAGAYTRPLHRST